MTPNRLASVAITETEAPNYHLSIRLCSDGFVCIIAPKDCADPSRDALAFRRFIPYIKSDSRTWVERFYENPFLAYPYGKVSIEYQPYGLALIPPHIDPSSENDWWLLPSPLKLSPKEVQVQSHEIGSGLPLLLAGWEREMFDFFMRTYPGADYRPSVLSTIRKALSESRAHSAVMLALQVGSHHVHIVVADKGQMAFANTFSWPNSSEVEHHLNEILYAVSGVRLLLQPRLSMQDAHLLLLEDGEHASQEMPEKLMGLLREKLG